MKSNLQFTFFALAAFALLLLSCAADLGTNCDQLARCQFITHAGACDRDADGRPIPGTFRITDIDTSYFDYSVCDTAYAIAKFYHDLDAFGDQVGRDALWQFLREKDNCSCEPLPQ